MLHSPPGAVCPPQSPRPFGGSFNKPYRRAGLRCRRLQSSPSSSWADLLRIHRVGVAVLWWGQQQSILAYCHCCAVMQLPCSADCFQHPQNAPAYESCCSCRGGSAVQPHPDSWFLCCPSTSQPLTNPYGRAHDVISECTATRTSSSMSNCRWGPLLSGSTTAMMPSPLEANSGLHSANRTQCARTHEHEHCATQRLLCEHRVHPRCCTN